MRQAPTPFCWCRSHSRACVYSKPSWPNFFFFSPKKRNLLHRNDLYSIFDRLVDSQWAVPILWIGLKQKKTKKNRYVLFFSFWCSLNVWQYHGFFHLPVQVCPWQCMKRIYYHLHSQAKQGHHEHEHDCVWRIRTWLYFTTQTVISCSQLTSTMCIELCMQLCTQEKHLSFR